MAVGPPAPSASARDAPRSSARPWLVLAAGAGLLAACSPVDGEQAGLCRAILPAVEPEGLIEVMDVARDQAALHGIRIAYTVHDGGRRRLGYLRCVYEGGRLGTDRLSLVDVETAHGRLGDAQRLFLERFWLGDPEALAAGEARILGGAGPSPVIGWPVGTRAGYFIQQVVNALPVSAVYAVLALAYALVYGLISRINLAFGEVAVLGSYAVLGVVVGTAGMLAGNSGAGVAVVLAAGLAVAAAQGALLGGVVGAVVYPRLARAGPRAFLIATIGLAIALGEAIRLAAASRDRWMQPVLNDTVLLAAGGYPVTVTVIQLAEIAGAAALLGLILAVFPRTRFGRAWRAAADDPLMARLLGLDVGRLATATFALSTGLAALAGGVTALHYGHASYAAGLIIGLKALAAALIGGLGSLPGAVIGGIVIGFGETLWAAYLPLAHRDIAILVALVLVLVLKPAGLFGVDLPRSTAPDRG